MFVIVYKKDKTPAKFYPSIVQDQVLNVLFTNPANPERIPIGYMFWSREIAQRFIDRLPNPELYEVG